MSKVVQRCAGVTLLLVVPCFLSACGRSTKGAKLVPVEGTVTDDQGNPVGGATVTFLPLATTGTSSIGKTDQSGKYSLSTAAEKGAATGKYKVTVSLLLKPDGTPFTEADAETGQDEGQAAAAGNLPGTGAPAGGKKTFKQAIAAKHSDPEKTELKFDVSDEGSTEANFKVQRSK